MSEPSPPPHALPQNVERKAATLLLADLEQATAAQDHPAARLAREGLVTQYPQHEGAAEAFYKLGLDALFVQRDLDKAMELFKAAIASRHLFWSQAARTSFGLCLLRTNNTQKALFELRKVAYVAEPTAHSVVALSFLEMVAAQENKPEEIRRVRRERIHQLEQRVAKVRQQAGGASELLSLLMQLGQALTEQGEHDRAKPILAEARAGQGRGQNQTGEFDRSVLDVMRDMGA